MSEKTPEQIAAKEAKKNADAKAMNAAAKVAFKAIWNDGKYPADLYVDDEGDLSDEEMEANHNAYSKILGSLAKKANIGKKTTFDV